ncbi:MAG: gluconate kinase, SKI family [Nitrobacter sp.]|uniref:gluconokinase n=1 Tax=Nitrobacter sp. TaxID=29420 RepID=UPI00387DDB82
MSDPNPAFRALIVMGVSGSGKSTIADALGRRLGWVVEDADQFHSKSNIEKMSAGIALTDDDRWSWLRAVAAEIGRKRANGTSIIMACSALKRAYRDILVQGHRDTRIVYLRGNKNLIADRLRARNAHFMPSGLLQSQFQTLEEPTEDERPIVVDVDATVDDIADRILTVLERSQTVS